LLRACRWRPCEIRGIEAGALGAAEPAEHRAATSPIQYGYLKTLPDDYIGPRHIVTVKQLPPGPGGYFSEDWFEWEERPGPEPASNASGRDDEILVHVCYVDAKMKA